MPTFVQLATTVHQEFGLSGSVVSYATSYGVIKRVFDYVIKANRKIQLRKGNWNFLWNNTEIPLISGAEYNKPDGLSTYDESSFWLNSGTVDARKIQFIPYKEWRDYYRNRLTDVGDVYYVTEKPNGKLSVLPPPLSTTDKLSFDYWRSPVDLLNDNQVSLIPEQFHGAIIAQAKMYMAEYKGDTGIYNASYVDHEEIYKALKAHSLPGNRNDIRSESSSDMIVMVE